MRGNGVSDMHAERAHFIMLMVISIVEIGITINVTDMELIRTKTMPAIKDIGKMICNMDKEKKHGPKVQNTKETM
jgi:hypothetical protein